MSGAWRGVVLLAQQEWRCAYCGYQWPRRYGLKRLRRMCRDRKPTVDHKLPLARGGANGMENWCIACQQCNTRKAILTDAEYRAVMHDNTLRRRAAIHADHLHRSRAQVSPATEEKTDG